MEGFRPAPKPPRVDPVPPKVLPVPMAVPKVLVGC